jgi:uncharacterized protein (DUF1800 family)
MSATWREYTPTPAAPWNVQRIVRLHRNAGFAATWPEIQRDLKDGPAASIERVLSGRSREGSVPADYTSRVARLEELAVASSRPTDLRAAWVYRMLHGPDPLGERLALMWHNHFATSNEKVADVRAMIRQNALFRQHARAPYGELLRRMSRDLALLIYLDAQENHKEHPNENLARELMELFTLGVGHYSEIDVREAARALTGWRFKGVWRIKGVSDNDARILKRVSLEQCIHYSSGWHEQGEKTILGRRGRWSGDDLVKILLEQPATADRLAWRITTEFLGEGVASQKELTALAGDLRASKLDVGKAVARVLRSERFFAGELPCRRVVGPVEWAVAAVRRFLPLGPPLSLTRLAEWAADMGQSLFYPPNVGGWPGGRAWLSPLALLGRANLAADLVSGRLEWPAGAPLDLLGLAGRHGRGNNREAVAGFLTELILGAAPDKGWTGRVVAAAGEKRRKDDFARRAAAAVLASPEAQLA